MKKARKYVFDIEVFPNYFCVVAKQLNGKDIFVIDSDNFNQQKKRLYDIVSKNVMISYAGHGFDDLIINELLRYKNRVAKRFLLNKNINEIQNLYKEKYKNKPAVYDLIEITTMEMDIRGKNKNFQELVNHSLENEKKMKEIKEITDKQMKKIVVVKDFFQSEENKREFKIVDELVYGFDLTLNFSKINEILENYSEDSSEGKIEVIKRAIDYYLRNIANNEKMTEDSIKYNIILENMYLKIMRMLASFDEKESEKFLNKLEKSKLYEVMRKLEE